MKESAYLKDNDEYLQKVREVIGLNDLEPELIKEMLSLSRFRQYEANEIIIREGDYDNWIYFLMEGEVVVRKGDIVIRAMRRVGDVFGEMGIIDGSPRSADIFAGAKKRTLCLAVDAACLERLSGNAKSAFHAVIYRVFSERLTERLRVMTQENKTLREKLAQYEKNCTCQH